MAPGERANRLTRRALLAGAGGTAAAGLGLTLAPGRAAAGTAVAPSPIAATAGAAAAARVAATPGPSAQITQRTLDAAPRAGAWVELDRAAIAANLAAVRERAGGRPLMGVVKANAYGHGIVPMARMLAEVGVDALMVITVDEALAVRAAAVQVPILNWGPFDAGAAEELVRQHIDQAVFTAEGVRGMAEAARRAGRPGRVHLVLDTGLGRVGVPHGEAGDVLAAVTPAVAEGTIELVGTATALTEDPDFDRVQLGRFTDVCERAAAGRLAPGARHIASSAAVLDFPAAHLDMVRPGIMLYGHYPNERSQAQRPIDLAPVLSLRARVACVKTLPAGGSIGYHRAWVAEGETTVATLPLGHSEGYPAAALAAGGWVEINGHACPLIGEITSDHLEVAVPAADTVRVGDVATLVGRGGSPRSMANSGAVARRPAAAPTAEQVGEWGGAGVYGTLMHVSPLLPRVVV